MALKKVALRKLEDGIPNQALREIKALQEIEDNPYVSVLTPLNIWLYITYKLKPFSVRPHHVSPGQYSDLLIYGLGLDYVAECLIFSVN